jgi:hypothetical protein
VNAIGLHSPAEHARLAEIDRYWNLCKTDPDRAAFMASGAAPIFGDLFHLARQTCAVPTPSRIPGLSAATKRLLSVAAVRDALVESAPCDPVDAFWEDGQVVAAKIVGGLPVLVFRYAGPLFNTGTVPASEVRSEAYGYLVCRSESIGDGGAFEYLMAYVIGAVAGDGNWKAVHLDLASRSDLMRDIPAMEALVEWGGLGGRTFDTSPLPTFPCAGKRFLRKNKHVHPDPDAGPEQDDAGDDGDRGIHE